MSSSDFPPSGQVPITQVVGETPTPADFVPVGPETIANLVVGDVLRSRAYLLAVNGMGVNPNFAAMVAGEARAMIDRELLEAVYVMLRVRP